MSELPAAPQRSWTWWRRIKFGLLIVFVVFLAVWNLLPPDVVREPVVLGRGVDGTLQELPPKPPGNRLHFNAQAGALQAQNTTFTGGTESYSDPAFLADHSLMILNLSDHVLMERIGTELLGRLRMDSRFDRLAYYPLGHSPEAGTEAPDLVLSINLESIEESGIAGRTLKARVKMTLGSSLVASHYSVNDHLSPPIVSLNVINTVEHQSSMTGIESSSAKYTLQGQDIAKQIANAVSDKLKTLREKFRLMPKLPAALRPEFVAAPEFEFLKRLQATRRTSFHGFMFHNETFWQFSSSENAEPLLTSLRDELQASGWRIDHLETKPGQGIHLRAEKESAILEVFPIENRFHQPVEIKEPRGPVHYQVRYLHRMNAAELHAVVAELLSAPKPDVEMLLLLNRFGSADQRQQTIKLIAEHPPRSVDAWLLLAGAAAGKNDVDACRRSLVRATLLLRTVTNPGDYEQRIKNLAKQQKIEEFALQAFDRDTFRELGIQELVAGAAPSTIEVTENSGASFFVTDAAKGDTVLTVRIQSDGNIRPNSPAIVTYLSASENSRSWSTQGAFHGVSKESHEFTVGQVRIPITIERLDNGVFRVSASRGQ